jgi:hypothetical protein
MQSAFRLELLYSGTQCGHMGNVVSNCISYLKIMALNLCALHVVTKNNNSSGKSTHSGQ